MPTPPPPGRSILLVGGARSGKSRIGQRLASAWADALDGPVAVFVTADAELAEASGDQELLDRIARHRADRPAGWSTVEAGRQLPAALEGLSGGPALVDCVTMWLSTFLPDGGAPPPAGGGEPADWMAAAEREVARLAAAVAARPGPTVVVSNEVGQGVVPAAAAGRAFRDLQGRANQVLAAACDRAYLVVAGRLLPLTDPNDVLEELT